MRTKTFPERGRLWPELEQTLIAERTKDTPWRKGLGALYWPDPGGNVRLVAKAASDLMFESFMLGARYGEPSARLVENDVCAMVQDILEAPEGAATTLTAGGTESNFHAVKTARDWARKTRPGATDPEILLPYTAHPSFDKAAHICGLRTVRVPTRADFRADVAAMARRVNANTVMIVGSAPSYSHGVVDDITDIAALAREHGLWCHVDSCVGGFLIPFLKRLGHPVRNFDFSVPGVRSVSADLHKFGLVLPHGISSFTLSEAADLAFQGFDFANWPYGRYAVTTFAGSRSGHVIAAAWATMRHLGLDGYLKRAEAIVRLGRLLAEGIGRIAGLRVLAPTEAGIFVFTGDGLDIPALASALEARGYPSSWCKEPPALHLLMYPVEDETIVEEYLVAVAESVAELRAGMRRGQGRSGYA
ncbi:MAG: pyridoxal phosphate-dependent decarboxylase family protein [Alphaproteobacteria bacterium]